MLLLLQDRSVNYFIQSFEGVVTSTWVQLSFISFPVVFWWIIVKIGKWWRHFQSIIFNEKAACVSIWLYVKNCSLFDNRRTKFRKHQSNSERDLVSAWTQIRTDLHFILYHRPHLPRNQQRGKAIRDSSQGEGNSFLSSNHLGIRINRCEVKFS